MKNKVGTITLVALASATAATAVTLFLLKKRHTKKQLELVKSLHNINEFLDDGGYVIDNKVKEELNEVFFDEEEEE